MSACPELQKWTRVNQFSLGREQSMGDCWGAKMGVLDFFAYMPLGALRSTPWPPASSVVGKMPSCHLHQLREVLVSSHPFTIPNDRQKLNTSLTLEEMNLFCSVLQAWSRQIAPIFYLNPSQYNITRLFNYLNKLPIQLYHFNFSSVFSNSAFLLYITVNLISSSPVWIINFCYQLKPNEKGKLAVKEDKGTGCCLWAGAQPSEQGSGGAHPSPSAQGWAHHRERQSPQVLLQSAELQGWPATRNSSVWPPKAKFRQWFEAHHARAQS